MAKKVVCVLLYAIGKGSYRMIGKILGTDPALVYRWIRKYRK